MKRQNTEYRRQNTEYRMQSPQATRRGGNTKNRTLYQERYRGIRNFLVFALCSLFFVLCSVSAPAQDDMIKFIDKKQKEIKEKEDALKTEDERLNALKRDVDERIAKYTTLLNQFENLLKKIEQINDKKLKNVVKAYEAMPPEDAAVRLSALDEPTAVKIILKMKSKKAGAVMALMKPKKAVSITKSITRVAKKFPTR